MKRSIFLILLILFISLFFSCEGEEVNKENKSHSYYKDIKEYEALVIPLKGEASEKYSEISGLCWYGSRLILLPQYPNRFGPDTSKIFFIEKDIIRNFISGNNKDPILPSYFAVDLSGLNNYFRLGSGFESAAVYGDDIFFTIEYMDKGKTETLLLQGTLDSLENEIKLNKTSIIKEKHSIYLNNTSNESIIVYNEKIIPIFEVYGNNLHKTPQVSIYSRDLDLISKINFPNIEYRITDVTAPDDSGKFWAINYFYPGDNEKLKPARDLIFSEFGIGATHRIYDPVERLVQFQILENKIIISPKAPIYIKLLGNESRNWEGIAKFDDKGFIIATDTFPETILAFIRINNG